MIYLSDMSILLCVPVDLLSESNEREHWAKKAARKKKQRRAVRQAWLVAGQPRLQAPIMLSLTRVHTSRRKIRDFDNLVSSFKAVIDEIADIAGINDKDIIWPDRRTDAFNQEVGKHMECKIEVRSMIEIGIDLTDLQAEFLSEWIKATQEKGYPPTTRELGEGFTWNTQQLLDYVVAKGYIERDAGVARGCRLTEKGKQWELKTSD